MKIKLPNIEAIIIFLIGLSLFIIYISSIEFNLLNIIYQPEFWQERKTILASVLLFYAIGFIILAFISYSFFLKNTSLFKQLNIYIKYTILKIHQEIHFIFSLKVYGFWLIMVLTIGIIIRLYFLNQPMRYDEAYTALNYISPDFIYVFLYTLPNNHVLNTLLAEISTTLFGVYPATIRLPAFLAGIILIPVIFYLGRKMKLSGIFASAAMAIFPYLIFFSTNARGYALIALFTVMLVYIGIYNTKENTINNTINFAIIAALGMFTIPSMLFSIAGIYIWVITLLLINQENLKNILYQFAIPAFVLTLIFTLILYTPVIIVSNGIEGIIDNRFVQTQEWSIFLQQLPDHLQSTCTYFFRDIPNPIILLFILLILIGLYNAVIKANWAILLILPMSILGAIFIFIKHPQIPFERTWIYMIPFFILVADSGFTWIIEKLSHILRILTIIIVLIISITITISLIYKKSIIHYIESGNFPEAAIAAQYLRPIITLKDIVYAPEPTDWTTYFYLWYYDLHQPIKEAEYPTIREFFIVQKSHYNIGQMTNKPVIKLLEYKDMVIYQATE